jgi:hypothetical protein
VFLQFLKRFFPISALELSKIDFFYLKIVNFLGKFNLQNYKTFQKIIFFTKKYKFSSISGILDLSGAGIIKN